MSNDKDKKPLEVVFAPGCFDTLGVSQEELEELMAELQQKFANMTPEQLAEMSRQLDEDTFDELPQEIKDQLENPGKGRNLQ